MRRSRNGFIYGLGFALVNMAEAIAILATLGTHSPGWVLSYAGWHMKRQLSKERAR